MTTFTVVIPTHNHADTLRYAVRSVQWQTCQDFEMFIVGDGVPDRTRELVAKLTAEDTRIRFFDFPKGDRLGELHRHHALQEASGRFVAYQADDDLWLPEHLASIADLLEDYDLVHCMQMEVSIVGQLSSWMFDAHDDPQAIEKMRNSQTGFGLASGAHRLDAYRRLPLGWHPAPEGINTDLYFWLQFLVEPWCRYRSYKWPNVLHLSSVPRKDWTIERRVEELSAWWEKIQTPAQRDFCVKQCLLPLHDASVKEVFRMSSSGLEEEIQLAQTPNGPMRTDKADSVIGAALRATVASDMEKIDEVLAFIKQRFAFTPEQFVDVGANIGTHLVHALKSCGFTRGLGFEPDPANYALLTQNIAAAGLSARAQVHRLALSSRSGAANFELCGTNCGDHRIRSSGVPAVGSYGESQRRVISVLTDTGDKFFEENKLRLSLRTLIRMATRGHEGHVLAGFRKMLSNGSKPFIVCEFWPYGLERAGGKEMFFNFLGNNCAFYDINRPNWQDNPEYSLSRLEALYQAMLSPTPEGNYPHTDLLIEL